ncbi:MAG: methylcobamide--CoM methyltransferase [Armatimonadota bacterium]|nr:methylcobamide--CoM methyltransferase [Armatimonadota bacterium]
MITTVVGSYPKIPDLPAPGRWRTAVEKFQRGEISEEELRRVEDEVTVEVLAEQAEAGVDLVTDGQIRWEDGQTYFARRLTGFSINGLQRYFDTNVYYREPVAEGEVRWVAPITVRDFEFARANSRKPVKPVITGPYTIARLSQNKYYPSLREFVLALARALNQEMRALEAAGAEIIQVDEPAILKHKEDFPVFAEAMGVLTEGVRAKKALYTYFGDVGGIYPAILDLPFEILGLDFVAGYRNWEVVFTKPFTKELGFGILDGRNTKMETVDQLIEDLRRITQVVPLERIYLNPSCGLEFLPRRVAKRKLEVMVQAAARAREIFG